MRLFLPYVCVAIGASLAAGQNPTISFSSKDTRPPAQILGKEGVHLEMVRTALRTSPPYNLPALVQLHRMGDEAAVNLLKILGTRTDFSEPERPIALEIIKRAFEEPASIMIANDRVPHATLFLLKYLNGLTEDAAEKAQIAETRESVAKSLKDAGFPTPQQSN